MSKVDLGCDDYLDVNGRIISRVAMGLCKVVGASKFR